MILGIHVFSGFTCDYLEVSMLISEGLHWICWNFMLDIGEVNWTELDMVILILLVRTFLASLFFRADLLKEKRLMSWKAVHLFLNVVMVRGNHFCDKFCQRQQKHRSAQKAGTSVCCCCCSPGDPVETFFCNFQVDLIDLWLWNHSPSIWGEKKHADCLFFRWYLGTKWNYPRVHRILGCIFGVFFNTWHAWILNYVGLYSFCGKQMSAKYTTISPIVWGDSGICFHQFWCLLAGKVSRQITDCFLFEQDYSGEERIPSRELTYPTWGKGKSSSNMPYQGDMLIPWRVHLIINLPNQHGTRKISCFVSVVEGWIFDLLKRGWAFPDPSMPYNHCTFEQWKKIIDYFLYIGDEIYPVISGLCAFFVVAHLCGE